MIKKPCRPMVYWNYLGRQLKLWHHNKVADAHATKLLKMWLGYEYIELMDDYGRYPSIYFSELRRRLGFSEYSTFILALRRCGSFFIVGTDENHITAIFSPLWHEWEEADGQLLHGSLPPSGIHGNNSADSCQEICQDIDVNNQINNIKDTTVGNDRAFSPEGELPRTVIVRRNAVSDYFRWMTRQTLSEHVALVQNIRYRIMNPRNKQGQIIESLKLTEKQTNEVWEILIDKVLPTYFGHRDDFFKNTYVQHPENRIWWMTAFFKKYGGPFITDARKKWRYGRRSRESEQAHEENQLQQQYRPLSPHEWQTPDGQRWYLTQKGQKQQIPETAEPRPTETSTFNYIKNLWQETKN